MEVVVDSPFRCGTYLARIPKTEIEKFGWNFGTLNQAAVFKC